MVTAVGQARAGGLGKEKLRLGGVKGESMADGQAKVVATHS